MEDEIQPNLSSIRRALVLGGALLTPLVGGGPVSAFPFSKKSSLYVVDTREEVSNSVPMEQVDTPIPTLGSEYALLKVLPVKNPAFRALETNIEAISALRNGGCKFYFPGLQMSCFYFNHSTFAGFSHPQKPTTKLARRNGPE